ncbi:MBL fold metallo-hydrolase [Georgenia faecalis]|uniref:MBL fold metallo-hydrolase n=1 Tax=Georgenia faecalis TaxID=2483799 RepID=A0ABV9D9V9_9MICO|nr:MBL fold metallo-hydrolase [Georgenia faecalis]
MLIQRVLAPVLEANCYVVAAGPGRPALVVDPGAGSAGVVRGALERHGLVVGAVAVTHGHPDHLWDAAEVAGDAPVLVAEADLPRLDDPAAWLGSPMVDLFRSLAATPWRTPAHPAVLAPGRHELVDGVVVEAVPAPGHTPGSTLLVLVGAARGEPGPHGTPPDADVVLTGDVLFAGSVGRTDLPGGDPQAHNATLRAIAARFPDSTTILPGHGPTSSVGAERAANPYLAAALRV